MTRDALGFDPLGFDPIAAVSQVSSTSRSREALAALRQGIVVRGVSILPAIRINADGNPEPVEPLEAVGPALGQDGKVLTLADRCRIAAERQAFKPRVKDLGYGSDLLTHATEQLGASAQAEIDKMPAIRLLPTREAMLPDARHA